MRRVKEKHKIIARKENERIEGMKKKSPTEVNCSEET